jgi:hypothetical protein
VPDRRCCINGRRRSTADRALLLARCRTAYENYSCKRKRSESAPHGGSIASRRPTTAISRTRSRQAGSTRDDVTQLGDVLAGKADGRRGEDEITVFDSTGLAIQDLAIALAAIEHVAPLDLPTVDL